jgi:hypothetical protein
VHFLSGDPPDGQLFIGGVIGQLVGQRINVRNVRNVHWRHKGANLDPIDSTGNGTNARLDTDVVRMHLPSRLRHL